MRNKPIKARSVKCDWLSIWNWKMCEKFVRRKKWQVYSHSNQDSEEDEDDSRWQRQGRPRTEKSLEDYETWTDCPNENT